MEVEIDLSEMIFKIKTLIRKELIQLFGSIGLDVSGYIDKMYKIEIIDNELLIDILLPYSDIIEYGATGHEDYDIDLIIEWYVNNINADIDEAKKFAEMYKIMLDNCGGAFLNHKIDAIVNEYLGD